MTKYTFPIKKTSSGSHTTVGGLFDKSFNSYLFINHNLVVNNTKTNKRANTLKKGIDDNISFYDRRLPSDPIHILDTNDIISDNKDRIIYSLKKGNEANVYNANIIDISGENAVGFFIRDIDDRNVKYYGSLKFINFNSKDNQLLKKYPYFTIEKASRGYSGCISDEKGNCVNVYKDKNELPYKIKMEEEIDSIQPKVFEEIEKDEKNGGNMAKNLAVLIKKDKSKALNKLSDETESGHILALLKSKKEVFEIVKDAAISDDIIASLTSTISGFIDKPCVDNNQIKLKIAKGENYGEINTAKVIDESGKDITEFSNIGYFFQDNYLHTSNYITGINIRVPKEFSFLKVVTNDKGECKFALCNSLGNLLFDHKKYDLEYSQLPKFVENSHIQITTSDFNKHHHCHTWRPLLQLKKGDKEIEVDVYEIATNQRVGTLIDEFVYYKNNKLHYKNNHNSVRECCYSDNLQTSLNNSLSIRGDMDYPDSIVNLEQSFDYSDQPLI